jgi:hypothetical protein
MKFWKTALLAILAVVIAPAAVWADNVVNGFASQETLQPGIVVQLDSSASKTVKTAPSSDTSKIYGVVVDPSDAPFTLNSQNAQVFVATSGIYRVFVSTVNGAIKPGDYISMSNLNGIGAKATAIQSTIVGQAQSTFDGSKDVITTNGGAAIGRIYVSVGVAKNPLANNDPAIPYFLKKLAVSLANKPVPVVRIYTALLVFALAAVAAITILWSGVRSGLISLGRNPLSRHAILGGMYKVIFTGLGVFAIGLAGVYLLLKI